MNTDDILSKLNPKTAALFRKASQIKIEILPTPSLGINKALGGGIVYGRQTMLWGNRSGGKTLFSLGLAANAQKQDKLVAWIDAEKNFDPAWARRHGVNPDDVLVSTITSIADMADAGYDLIKNGVDVLVVDSISALLPQSYFVDGEMKALADTGQIGTFSKNMGAALNMFNNINQHTAIVLISQVRNQIGSYGASISYMGGKAVDHMNSTTIKLWSNPSEKESIKGNVSDGDLIFTKPIGRPVTWTIDKSRGAGMNQTGIYDMYFAGDTVGIDLIGEIITYGVEYGIIKKSGNWLSYGEMEKGLNGAKKFRDFLIEHPAVYGEIYDAVMEKAAT